MVKDQTSIVGISDLNPIQFWPPDKPTFNQKKIPLLLPQKFYQRFKFDESLYNRLDVAFSTQKYKNWDATISYSIGDVVYDPSTLTRWVSNSNANLNHTPNPVNTAMPHPSPYWDHDPLFGVCLPYDFAVNYQMGDRVLYYSGSGTAYAVAQSLVDNNLGNQPNGNIPVLWDQVQESRGDYKLQFLLNGVVTGSLNFDSIRLGSTHQFTNWLFSDYPEFKDARIQLNILDVDNNIILAQSDCIDVVMMGTNEPYLTIQYTNSDDYAGVAMEVVNPQYYLPLPAHFYREIEVVEGEDNKLTNGRIVSLRRQLVTKKLLNIIDPLPDYAHKKIRRVLTCDNVIIDDLPWKWDPVDSYNNPDIDTSQLSYASVLLTQADSVLINLSKYDANSGGRVFSGEFANPFS